MRHYQRRSIIRGREGENMRRIEPRQLLTEDVLADAERGAHVTPSLTLRGGGHMVLCKSLMFNN
jgi:hypothetical protein